MLNDDQNLSDIDKMDPELRAILEQQQAQKKAESTTSSDEVEEIEIVAETSEPEVIEVEITTDKDEKVEEVIITTVDSEVDVVVSSKDNDDDEEEDDSDDISDEELFGTQYAGVTGDGHADFNWDAATAKGIQYDKAEFDKLYTEYSSTLTFLEDNEVVDATVSNITDTDVVLNLHYKSDGIIPKSEFRDTPDLSIGDSIPVYIEKTEDSKGRLILSRRKAKLLRAWDHIVDSYNNGTVIKGTIVSKTKGGLIAECGGLETFLPGSQIDVKQITDYDSYVGKTMEFKVVKINEAIKNAVVSHKALIESDLAEQREQIIAGLEKGQVLEGVVKNITDFGAFIDLGGLDGLLYITDISWGRISNPRDVLDIDEKLRVVVLDFDENKKRISLGLKQLQPHPWEVLDETIVEGSVVKGKVVNIEDYGAFLEIIPGVEGLVHVSEVSWSNQPINAREYFTVNEEYEAKVVTIDREEKKMSLSIKMMSEDPWGKIAEQYPIGSHHKGIVKNLTPFGVFVEMDDSIGGMIHISDLSWLKRYNHPSEFTKVGDEIEFVILEIDNENRKMSLGHKQLEENPWDTFENVFPIGSYHQGTVIRKDDKGAIVQLPYGLEAFSPSKHLRKEDGSFAEVDDVLTFKVIEFNRDDKRILVSHTRFHDDVRREAEDTVKETKKKERNDVRREVKKQSDNIERTTLGDLAIFDDLKEQIQENDAQASTESDAEPPSE